MEPVDTPIEKLRLSLLNGSYAKPYIIDDGITRSLHFGHLHVQSSMRLDDPVRLRLHYTQKMMGCLLFNDTPKQITMIGLGGGSLAKYCHHHLPTTDITVVEINPYVVALREYFLVPPDSNRFRVIIDDGMNHLAGNPAQIDLLMVDACDGKGVAPAIASDVFLQHAFRRLGPKGVFVMNLTGDIKRYEPLLSFVRQRFHNRIVTVPDGGNANHILFAFKEKHYQPDWTLLRQQARTLSANSSIDYFSMAKVIEQAWAKNDYL